MLEVQGFLRHYNSLDRLNQDYAIDHTCHPSEPLVILNYNQIESPKTHPIVQECRGLVLETANWDLVARPFTRFFNAGECPNLERQFNWKNFSIESKEDGSMMILYFYNGQWRVNTRSSFANGNIAPGINATWAEMFWDSLDKTNLLYFNKNWTYVFEFCSLYNKVVREYTSPTLFLLTAFHTLTGIELNEISLDVIAERSSICRPAVYDFETLDEIKSFLDSHDDCTFEGVVIRDSNGMRLKIKNSRYVALHQLKNNGAIFHTNRIIELVLSGDIDELITYYPEVAPYVFDIVEELGRARARLNAIYCVARKISSQKEFAAYVNKHTELSSILFDARRHNVEPDEIFNKSSKLLYKKLFKQKNKCLSFSPFVERSCR